MILWVLIALILMLLLFHNLFDRDFASPSVLYLLGFGLCSFVGYLFISEWKLQVLNSKTLVFLIGGALIFCLTEWLLRKTKPLKKQCVNCTEYTYVPIPNKRLIAFVFFQIISLYMFARFQMMTGQSADLGEALSAIDSDYKYEGILVFPPWYINIPNQISIQSGYVWACLIAWYFQSPTTRVKRFLIFVNFWISTFGTLLGGSRMVFLEYIITAIIMSYLVYMTRNKWSIRTIPLKVKVLLVGGALTFSTLFGQLGSLVGRDTSDSFDASYLFAFYCGAEIKNLDIYMSSKPASIESSFPLRSTLNGIYKNLEDRKLIVLDKVNSSRFDFNTVNGYFLGNVSTCYTTYYDDLGLFGVFIVGLFAAIVYLVYRKSIQSVFFRDGRLTLWLIVYAWMAYAPFMSFFAEEFFRRFSFEGMIRNLVIWWLIVQFLQGTKRTYYTELIKNKQYECENFGMLP